MRSVPDASVVAGLRTGDQSAFEAAYQRYKADVLSLVAAMLGQQDGAWDVLHDVFVSLARQGPRLDPDCNLKGYLMTSAANRVRDRLRKRQPRQADTETLAEVHSRSPGDPLNVLIRKSEASQLWRALAALPEEQRAAVALRIYGGLTVRQIAQREGVSENTVQSRYRYAIEKLRQEYTEKRP